MRSQRFNDDGDRGLRINGESYPPYRGFGRGAQSLDDIVGDIDALIDIPDEQAAAAVQEEERKEEERKKRQEEWEKEWEERRKTWGGWNSKTGKRKRGKNKDAATAAPQSAPSPTATGTAAYEDLMARPRKEPAPVSAHEKRWRELWITIGLQKEGEAGQVSLEWLLKQKGLLEQRFPEEEVK